MKDCTFYVLTRSSIGHPITVVKCPNSTTSTTEMVGKTVSNTTVIDGAEHMRKTEDK